MKTTVTKPWYIFTPYRENLQQALCDLQRQEFREHRYDPYGILASEEIVPTSIAALRNIMDVCGTATVIDLLYISDCPDYCSACPLTRRRLISLFGTDQPTRRMIEGNSRYLAGIKRGQGCYIIAYKDGEPDEILFAGRSFD